ncbi:unnamed protein product [Toxocara canis]|uniref:Uncharacterized protein n=1 Tax=Toxocara canis TaxID=6265 RepID=A0A183VET2_TOXCA|nr:unnamed protein product [Toxocara canis]
MGDSQLSRYLSDGPGCVHDLLRCVQMFKDVHFSRRKIGSHSWHPYTVPNVPSSCECMWPVDKYGHQEL